MKLINIFTLYKILILTFFNYIKMDSIEKGNFKVRLLIIFLLQCPVRSLYI